MAKRFVDFFVSQCQKNRRGTLLCFKKCLVMKLFIHRRWEHLGFIGIFCLAVPKKFVGGTLVFQTRSSMEKMIDKGRVSRFPSEIFPPHSAGKIRRGTLLCLKKIFVMGIFMNWRGVGGFTALSNFFSHSSEKFRSREPCVSENFWYGKEIEDKREGITFFRSIFFVSQNRNFS